MILTDQQKRQLRCKKKDSILVRYFNIKKQWKSHILSTYFYKIKKDIITFSGIKEKALTKTE